MDKDCSAARLHIVGVRAGRSSSAFLLVSEFRPVRGCAWKCPVVRPCCRRRLASIGDMRTPVRLRSVYLPTEACWQINDLMCSEGLKVRELPTSIDLDKAA